MNPRPTCFRRSLCLGLAAAAGVWGGLAGPLTALEPLTNEIDQDFLSGSLLPDGSILKDVRIPTYDDSLQLEAYLRAVEMVLHTRNELEGRDVVIEFYSGRKSEVTGLMRFAQVFFDRSTRVIRSRKPVDLISPDLEAKGSGLVFEIDRGVGFFEGPVTAVANFEKEVSMKASSPGKSMALAAMVAVTPVAAAKAEAPAGEAGLPQRMAEARLSEEELQEIRSWEKSLAAGADGRRAAAEGATEEVRREDAELLQRMLEFGKTAGVKALLALAPGEEGGGGEKAAGGSSSASPVETGGDVPGPPAEKMVGKSRIRAEDGAFLDRVNRVLVFLKNVEVIDPRFEMTGADEVKVYFSEKEGETEKVEDKGKGDVARFAGSGLGEVERVVATGLLKIKKNPDKEGGEAMQASGRSLIYDRGKDVIILRGGSPWMLAEKFQGRVNGPNAYITYSLKTGEVVTGGGQVELFGEVPDRGKGR